MRAAQLTVRKIASQVCVCVNKIFTADSKPTPPIAVYVPQRSKRSFQDRKNRGCAFLREKFNP